MIPANALRTVTTSGVSDSTEFGLSMDDSAHIMTILRDTLYSDKILAVLREYSSNAWDAHRDAGKADIPIKVTLPTWEDPTLTIRDYGLGLSHEGVFNVFTKYGASTKRGSNTAVGMLGIGSKSGFAYSDTFTVTSYHGGRKRTYVAILDPSDKGEMKLLYEAESNETGLEIQIPIRKDDIQAFQDRAERLFYHFEPRPIVNCYIPTPPRSVKLDAGEIYEGKAGEWVAVMGCVAYRVNLNQLREVSGFDVDMFHRVGGSLSFKIGEVHINASREELKYSDQTKRALVDKLNELLDEYVTKAIDEIENGKSTPWEKRLKAQVLGTLSALVPKEFLPMMESRIVFGDLGDTTSFSMQHGKNIVGSFVVSEHARLVMQDDSRNLRGFQLGQHDYIIKPKAKKALAEARTELDQLLTDHSCTGIPIVNLSTIPWVNPPTRYRNGNKGNIKHRVKNFKLRTDRNYYSPPYSDNWLPEVEREATDEDVFIIIESFKPTFEFHGFYHNFPREKMLAEAMEIPVPDIYAYKRTAAKPITAAGCQGISYNVWRESLHAQVRKNPKAQEIVDTLAWQKAGSINWYGYSYSGQFGFGNDISDSVVAFLKGALGEEHPITSFAIRALEAKRHFASFNIDKSVAETIENSVIRGTSLPLISTSSKKSNEEPSEALKKIRDTYPMLKVAGLNLPSVWGSGSRELLDYIKLVDASKKG